MSCSRVRFHLSEYLDGEIQGADREAIEKHLAECKACALAFSALQNTSRLLAEASEMEPPAQLLAQIEAATIHRPTFGQRVRASFEHLTRVPASARWAMASAVAAVAVVFAFTAGPNTQQHALKAPSGHVQVHPNSTATVPSGDSIKSDAGAPTATAASQPMTAQVHKSAQRRHSGKVAKAVVRHRTTTKPAAQQDKAVAAKPQTPAVEVSTDESAPQEARPEQKEMIAAAPAPETEKEMKIVQATSTQPNWQQKEQDALADLRAKLAAKNKQRRYQVREEPVEGRKVSVDLASIRF